MVKISQDALREFIGTIGLAVTEDEARAAERLHPIEVTDAMVLVGAKALARLHGSLRYYKEVPWEDYGYDDQMCWKLEVREVLIAALATLGGSDESR